MSEVVALAGWPPEVLAYAYAIYSRSALSIRESIKKITAEKSAKFFDDYYFAFSHASIADNAHIPLALENIPQITAFEIEDEQLIDLQERSTRYQVFEGSSLGYFTPRSVCGTPQEANYQRVAEFLFSQYDFYAVECKKYLMKKHQKPPDMKDTVYERTMKARAFDIARYWLFNGILTNVGQITSARTLERQVARLGASRYEASRDIAQLMKQACREKPFCPEGKDEPPLAPTLMKHADASEYLLWIRSFIGDIAGRRSLVARIEPEYRYVELGRPESKLDEILATLLYEAVPVSYGCLLRAITFWPYSERESIVREVMRQRPKQEPHHRAFAAGMPYQFDILMDIGGRRDLHRHRNCIQIHQPLSLMHGFEVPELVTEMGLEDNYCAGMNQVEKWIRDIAVSLDQPQDADYLIPFGFMSGTIYKMTLSEALYIIQLRSGVKGHFSYRDIACRMDTLLKDEDVFLEHLTRVTPLSEEDLLTR